ncbi:MAG: hypothetical protein RIK87_29410 [Fuerstiella sp.]
MLDTVVRMFTRRDPRREAASALTRIMNRHDVIRLSYEDGVFVDRRGRNEKHVAMGVWLFPCAADPEKFGIRVGDGVPAVTHDMRPNGFGIMTPMRLQHHEYAVAVQDEDDSWKFFRCKVRHNTRKPGGWYHLGMEVERVLSPTPAEQTAFHQHVQALQLESDSMD